MSRMAMALLTVEPASAHARTGVGELAFVVLLAVVLLVVVAVVVLHAVLIILAPYRSCCLHHRHHRFPSYCSSRCHQHHHQKTGFLKTAF